MGSYVFKKYKRQESHSDILSAINTLRPRQNEQHFADDIFKRIFFNENVWISIKISLKFVPKGPINYNPALVQIMAWRRSGDKPLSEPTMVSLPTHIYVTRPQWINSLKPCAACMLQRPLLSSGVFENGMSPVRSQAITCSNDIYCNENCVFNCWKCV